MLSVVIPTLNAAGVLKQTLGVLRAARDQLPHEVIVADGGSGDETMLVAEAGGAIVVDSGRGRGRQLAAGATHAGGDWFLFLHADTCLSEGWVAAANAFMSTPKNRERAAFFRFALDAPGLPARLIEVTVRARCKLFGLPYGDQGLLISRSLYEELGGYKRIPLMEDVDFVKRIGRRRLRRLPALAVTSAERYQQDGYFLRPLINLFCFGLYSLGVPPKKIYEIYY